MALQYVTSHLLPILDEITDNDRFARVQQYVIDNSVENFDTSNCRSPSFTSSSNDNYANDYQDTTDDDADADDSYTSSTLFDFSLSQLSIASTPSNSDSSFNSDDDSEKESPSQPSNLLNIPTELKKYMDHYPDVLNLVQNNIDLISAECTDLENYMQSDFGIFGLMKEALVSPEGDIRQNQNLEMICEMTEILQEKIGEMELANKNLNTTQEAFENILATLNVSSL